MAGYESVYAARQAQAAFLADPFNKQNWKNLRAAEANVQVLNGKAGKQLSEIADQRTQIMQQKLDNKQQTGLAESLLEESFINHLNGGMDDTRALGAAIRDVRKRYPGVPFDATKIIIRTRRAVANRDQDAPDILGKNLQAIDAAQSTIDYADEIMERIQANPRLWAGCQSGDVVRRLCRATVAGRSSGWIRRRQNSSIRRRATMLKRFQELLRLHASEIDGPVRRLDLKVIQHAWRWSVI